MRLGLGHLGLSLRQGGLGRARIQGEQQLAALDHLAVAEVDGLDIAADAGAHVHALNRFEASGELVPVPHLLLQRHSHRHGRRALRGRLYLWGTTIKRTRHHDGYRRNLQPAHLRISLSEVNPCRADRGRWGVGLVNAW